MAGRGRFGRHVVAVLGVVAIFAAIVAPPMAETGAPAGRGVATPGAPVGPERGTLWVQDNNLAQAGGITPDFKEMFTTRTAEWAEA